MSRFRYGKANQESRCKKKVSTISATRIVMEACLFQLFFAFMLSNYRSKARHNKVFNLSVQYTSLKWQANDCQSKRKETDTQRGKKWLETIRM